MKFLVDFAFQFFRETLLFIFEDRTLFPLWEAVSRAFRYSSSVSGMIKDIKHQKVFEEIVFSGIIKSF